MTYEEFTKKFNLTPDEQQSEVIKSAGDSGSRACCVIAVPGGGKTTTLVSRIGYQVHCLGVDPGEILTMTYTKAATADMKKRYESLFGTEHSDKLTFSTINAVCYGIIRHAYAKEGKALPKVIEDDEQSKIVREIYLKLYREYPDEQQKKDMISQISLSKNKMQTDKERSELKKHPEDDFSFAAFFDKYEAALRARGLIDFDDQLVIANDILKNDTETRRYFLTKYRYINVDEIQDSSHIQHNIIAILTKGREPWNHLCVVGDDDQSIYRFRAAEPLYMRNMDKIYPGAKILKMETNYRSTDSICALAQSFINKDSSRYNKVINPARGVKGDDVKITTLATRFDQYNYLLKKAITAKEELAILYRNNESAVPIIDLFERNNIGYRARGLECMFFNCTAILDITAIMRLALNPSDKEIFEKVYYKLNLYLKKTAMMYVLKHCPDGENIFKYMYNHPSELELNIMNRQKIGEIYQATKNYSGMPADDAVAVARDEMGYDAYMEGKEISGKSALNVLELLGQREKNAESLLKRLDELREIMEKGTTDRKSNIVLSAIHSSKGLEYKNVIIIDVIDGILPNVILSQKSTKGDFADYLEERRVMYVAMTRAKDTLEILEYAEWSAPSAFVRELRTLLNPPKAEEKKDTITTIKAKKTEKPKIRLSPSSAPANVDTDVLKQGVKVHHKAFGDGIVLSMSGEIVKVLFDEVGEKQLGAKAALKNRLLEIIEE